MLIVILGLDNIKYLINNIIFFLYKNLQANPYIIENKFVNPTKAVFKKFLFFKTFKYRKDDKKVKAIYN